MIITLGSSYDGPIYIALIILSNGQIRLQTVSNT